MVIIKKCKKLLISMGIALFSMINKVYSVSPSDMSTMYGIEKPKPVTSISNIVLDILKYAIIPFIALIGIIIYFKNSKESTKIKFLVLAAVLGFVVLFDIIIYMLLNDMF